LFINYQDKALYEQVALVDPDFLAHCNSTGDGLIGREEYPSTAYPGGVPVYGGHHPDHWFGDDTTADEFYPEYGSGL